MTWTGGVSRWPGSARLQAWTQASRCVAQGIKLALLDIDIVDGDTFDLARVLAAQQIAFALMSGQIPIVCRQTCVPIPSFPNPAEWTIQLHWSRHSKPSPVSNRRRFAGRLTTALAQVFAEPRRAPLRVGAKAIRAQQLGPLVASRAQLSDRGCTGR